MSDDQDTNRDELIVQPKETTTTSSVAIRPVRSMTCSICLENIAAMHKQFGLQNNCDHFFCFDCLSTWRRTEAMMDRNISGRCPLCRTRSTFIAPSWRCFSNTDDKQSLIDAHKLHLKTIQCRFLLRYNHCKFGRRCYYNHQISSIRTTLFGISQENRVPPINENNNDEQQEPSRRITYSSHRYRPY